MAFTTVPVLLGISLSVAYVLVIAAGEDIVVSTAKGPVRGSVANLQNKPIYTFKNIPFAKAPNGTLRFRAPEEVPSWTDVLDATIGKSVTCPQIPDYPGPFGSTSLVGQEDCLVLDIYTAMLPSQTADNKARWPVLVYFHGGLFSYGSKNEYGPAFLLKENEIVLVIANYRLGVLGYLSTQDNEIPGNFGLMDQRMALKWVQRNIGSFGGDAERVTIAGHDAGGVSVGLHILSPSSQEYFSGAISGSGTACDPWALTANARSAALKFAQNVNCPGSPSRALIDCLQKKSIDELLQSQRFLRNVTFRPTIDNSSRDPFIPDQPGRLYERGKKTNVPYLAGVTANEASIEYYTKLPEVEKKRTLDEMLLYLLEPYLQGTPNIDSVVKAAKFYYLRGFNDIPLINTQLSDLLSDFLYKSGLNKTMGLHSSNESPGYMYVFEFTSDYPLGDTFGPEDKAGKNLYGVSHMEDVIYLFNTSFATWVDTTSTQRVKTFRDTMCKIWGNFVIDKIPTIKPSGTQNTINWPRFELTKQQYMKLSESIREESKYREEKMEFWNVLVPELQAVNVTGQVGTQTYVNKADSATWGVTALAILLGVLCLVLTAVVIITRNRYLRRSSVPVSSTHEKEFRSQDV